MRKSPNFRFISGGTGRHFFSMNLLQKLLAQALLITCVEVWLEKITLLQKTFSMAEIPLLPTLFTPPQPVILSASGIHSSKFLTNC